MDSERQVETTIEARHENLVARLNISIERALTTLALTAFPGAILNKVYRPVERKTWLRRRTIVVHKLDNGSSGRGVAGWALDEMSTWLLLADGKLAYFGYITDRTLAELAGCEPTTNYVVIPPDQLESQKLEDLIEAIGDLEQACLLASS